MSNTQTLCIRADANSEIGIGHIMRCLALAQAWQDRGGNVRFIAAIETPALAERIRQEGMEVAAMTAQPGSEEDLHLTIDTAKGCPWLVLDGYHFSRDYMLGVQQSGLHLLLIDDLADRDLSDIEAVLNQNAYASAAMHERFHKVPRLLLGAGYTLLRREFLQNRGDKEIARDGRRVLITLGGADVQNTTLQVLRALRQVTAPLEVRVIVGVANRHVESLQAELLNLTQHQVTILVNPPDMPAQMKWSDVTITAAGSSCWELCCLGVPLLMLVTAENQRLMPGYFRQHDIAEVFGELGEARVGEFAERLTALLGNPERRAQLSQAAALVVDGAGAERAVRFMWA